MLERGFGVEERDKGRGGANTFGDGLDAASEDLGYGVGRVDGTDADASDDFGGVVGGEIGWDHAAH